MPYLDQISYSRQVCLDSIRDYYTFLTNLHLPESYIQEPPEGGWPHITPSNLRAFGKTDEVIVLLRHLPYIRPAAGILNGAQGAPGTAFADWSDHLDSPFTQTHSNRVRMLSEGYDYELYPAHVIGLTYGAGFTERFLLDTHLGVIYWLNCRGEIAGAIAQDTYPERLIDRVEEYATSKPEDEWRDSAAWAVPDFFEMFERSVSEDEFLSDYVWGCWGYMGCRAWDGGQLQRIQEVLMEHGWPDLGRYRKRECVDALHGLLGYETDES